MARTLTIFFLLPLISFSQTWQWTKSHGGLGNDIGHSICTDAVGNCYASVDSSGQAIIIKYNSFGNLIWNVNTWIGSIHTIISDNSGHLYLCGDSSNNRIVAKFDTSGNIIWKINGGSGKFYGICLDNFGHFYLTGLSSIQKYDTSGFIKWQTSLNIVGKSICTDNFGNCYITGYFNNVFSNGTFLFNSKGPQDIFITKYDSSGNCIWAKKAGGNSIDSYSNDFGNAIIADNTGNIYITGSIADSANFDSFTLIANHNDIFLAKYDENGNALWVKQASGISDEEGRCIAIDDHGDILIGGSYVANVNFDSFQLTGWGNYDAYIAKYDSMGNFLGAIKAGGPIWNEYVYGISIDNSGDIFAIGSYSDTAYFGNDTLTSVWAYDIFISKLNILTGIEEKHFSPFDVNISPNPSNGIFTIDIDRKVSVREIRITDMNGKVVLLLPARNNYSFNLDKIQSGNYILSVVDKNNRFINRRIINFH